MFATTALIVALITAEKPVSFKADVAPILVASCLGCHNDQKASNGLNMKTFALLKKGGKSVGAETIVVGDSEASHLIEVLMPDASPRMPLKLAPLAPAQIAILERWVKEGAKFDGKSESETTLASLVNPLANLPKVAAKSHISDPVTSVAITRDGLVIVASIGKNVHGFDAKTGKNLFTLGEHAGAVNAVAISPDGKSIIAAGGRSGQFGFVTVWDLKTKTARFDLRGHTDAILASSLSPDGKLLATSSYDRMIKLWDLTEGREQATLKEHTDAVNAVAFSADGKRLVSGGSDRTVKVWDVKTGKRLVSFPDSTGEVYSVAFSNDGNRVFGGGSDRSIRAWDLKEQGGAIAGSVFAHSAPLLRLVISPDGKRIVSTSEDKSVKIWEIANLKPLANLGVQADWPYALAFSPDGKSVAIGRYDGSLALLDVATGKESLAVRAAPKPVPPASKPKPSLVQPASLNPPSPRGGVAGTKVHLTLTGVGVGQAHAITFDDPNLIATIIPATKPDANRLDVDLAIAKSTRPGIHRVVVQTPLGTPAGKTFAVCLDPEVNEIEPDDVNSKLAVTKLPSTLVGTLDKPGDEDAWLFEGEAGENVVFEVVAKDLGSTADLVLTLTDLQGKVIARAVASPTLPDPILTATLPQAGSYRLIVGDAQFGGDGNHFYRITAGRLPLVTSVFPRGVQAGKAQEIEVQGANIIKRLNVDASKSPIGALIYVQPSTNGRPAKTNQAMVVAEGEQRVESKDASDRPLEAAIIAFPGGVSGVIDRDGDADFYRFEAKRGHRAIIELYGRRLGSPIDSAIEILDKNGMPVPRAVLRPVVETNVAFRDHAATSRAIRLTKWEELSIGDYLYVGRELIRLSAMPRNPDDDAVMWGLGNERSDSGERMAFLETTNEHHPLSQPMYKVEIHPPGTQFPEGGQPPVTLNFRNDDGGPGFGKDSRVTFDPPADGTYLVRVEDSRGLGGAEFGYHLIVRDPRPDFAITLTTADPNIPRGSGSILRVDLARKDGFRGAVDVSVEGLPPGITATKLRIEPDTYTGDILLSADDGAAAFSKPGWRVVARTVPSSTGEAVVTHSLDLTGRLTVTPEPDLHLTVSPSPVRMHPGQRVEITLAVDRGPAFAGRVPIDIRNLPLGVRVLNIGLNGVLVTESQKARSIFLYAEPWVQTTTRPFYAVGRVEASGQSSSAPPMTLQIEPNPVIGVSR
jgi:hypothetical protein